MELRSLARTNGSPAALAYGVFPSKDGEALLCGLLLVQKGLPRGVITFQDPASRRRYRVRVPKLLVRQKKNARASRLRLELLA